MSDLFPFTASNGTLVYLDSSGDLFPYFIRPGTTDFEAVEEMFVAKRDASLGRWRSKEHPDYVVYLAENGLARVLNESDGRTDILLHRPHGMVKSVAGDVAREFFAAHPEPKPLPTEEGVYAVSPRVHPYERLLQLRNGEWIHLRRSASEFESDDCSAEWVAQTAVNEGRLTRLIAEVK